jgi:acetyltransferase-like isoleucine patch superfamily enzyme
LKLIHLPAFEDANSVSRGRQSRASCSIMFVDRTCRAVHFSLGRIASTLRILWFRLCFPGLEIGRGVTIGRGVRITVLRSARLRIGARSYIEPYCQLRSDGHLDIGPDSFVGQGSVIVAVDRIVIGNFALIAPYVTIRDQDHGTSAKPYRLQPHVSAPVELGDNVWVGSCAAILKGVTVGDNAIVAAGAVVTKSVAPGSRVAGIPARPMAGD